MDREKVRAEIAQEIRDILCLVNEDEDPADVLADEIVAGGVRHVEVATEQ